MGVQDFQRLETETTTQLRTQKDSVERTMDDDIPLPSSSLSSWQRSSVSDVSGLHEYILNMSAQSSHHHNSTAAGLIKEIAVLEVEVMHLERYLLSLYRTTFDHYAGIFPFALTPQSSELELHDARHQISQETTLAVQSSQLCASISDITNQSHGLEDGENLRDCKIQHARVSSAGTDNSTCHHPREHPTNTACSGLRSLHSLADHLGTSLADHIPMTPDRLSEEILRCISSIYCKLSKLSPPEIGLSASPTSSLSSCSTFSPQENCDNWSPRCNDEAPVDHSGFERFREKHGPYSGMLEVPRISVDNNKFNYAAKMLQSFRSLIQHLENVDPRNMKYEEKLAFWINIHNALVMHAYLAYGIPQKQITGASFTQKAAYNVRGHFLNASVIQGSILGCRSHHPAPWLRTLFRSSRDKHIYTLDHREPLVHFALCSGAYSDPAVRLYTAKSIFQELELAREEFIQASVCIHKDKKIILPKVLNYFAKDASIDLSRILEMVQDSLPEAEQKVIQSILKERGAKCIEWSSQNLAFRYILHRELANL